MLNFTFYSGVAIQKDYRNVLYFASVSNFLSYLNTYKTGELSNVNQFYDGHSSIQLGTFFENANYVCINDTNSNTPYKFYFIDNITFVSASTIKYDLTLDVWHTYQYNLTMKSSLMIEGHGDLFNQNDLMYKLEGSLKPPAFSNDITNKVIAPVQANTKFSYIAIIKTSGGVQMIMNGNLTNQQLCNQIDLLSTNIYHVGGGSTTTYEIMNVYIIPNFDIIEDGVKYWEEDNFYGLDITLHSYHDIYLGNQGNYDRMKSYLIVNYVMYQYEEGEGADAQTITDIAYYPLNLTRTISSAQVYKTNDKKARAKSKIYIGSMNNYQPIDTYINTNPYMYLKLNVVLNDKVELYFECMNVRMNLSTAFEIPFTNDAYNLYMNTNKSQIDAENKAMATSYILSMVGIGAGVALSGATGGASLMMAGLSMATATSGVMTKEIKQNARLSDMANQLDRFDGAYTNYELLCQFGIGAFAVYYSDTTIDKAINKFGYICDDYITTFNVNNNNVKYYYIKTSNVNLIPLANYNVMIQLENIFNSGVRIWKDTAHYLDDINYI